MINRLIIFVREIVPLCDQPRCRTITVDISTSWMKARYLRQATLDATFHGEIFISV